MAALSQFDLTGDGKVSTADLTAGAKALTEQRKQSKFLKKLVIILIILVVVLLIGTFSPYLINHLFFSNPSKHGSHLSTHASTTHPVAAFKKRTLVLTQRVEE